MTCEFSVKRRATRGVVVLMTGTGRESDRDKDCFGMGVGGWEVHGLLGVLDRKGFFVRYFTNRSKTHGGSLY